ncbi:hypothetical protein AVEN_152883-1 [Araneus ventricosus]|uniref:Uncharacterized protein n=1 Tax=Araneus ventricosus TaxID=182803 RepID=A0A4Y2AEK1_ARAVE|nr:hypothetical protein AVEN_152883-1 [Araneus ventricosus]
MKGLRKLLAEVETDKESDFDNGPEDIVAQNRPMGAWCKQSNTQVNGELKFIHKYAGKHVAQVTGTIDLEHISNANRQQFTGNNSSALSDLATQTVSKSLIMTITELSIAFSSPAF